MREPRKGFVFYQTWWVAIANLPRDVQGDVLTAIIEYGLYGETTERLKPIAKAMLEMVKPQVDANCKKYEAGKLGAEFGKLGGRPKGKKPQENPKETPAKPQENPYNNKYKDKSNNISSSSSRARGGSDEEDGLKKEIEIYKYQKPVWKEGIQMKFGMSAGDVNEYLDKFYLDMRCREVNVYKLSALFTSWLSQELSNANTGDYQPKHNGIRSKLPPEPDYGLIED